ncbi:hypothetical protein [Devosia sp. Leaf64]|uniref:hypothetical protein n=1 Tax=Devosia sp. Leaf64 TaxID=1736229 RepID=UPI000715C5A6|nr:hypothetical protein [Devosia sp. Leaf64]KQN73779.1 hypothetical protein ASE94_05905 [Devosia sp. Leaf64]
MRTFLHVTAGTLLGLMLTTGLTVPSLAQPTAKPAAADIDFGNDSSDWAKDGECDDPRFTGDGMADQLVDEDILKDATDCKAAFDAGKITIKDDTATAPPTVVDINPPVAPKASDIDFGDDSSEWAKDGECDDPRFTGTGSAQELVDADLRKDATDCKAAFEAGTVTLVEGGEIPPAVNVADIDFGDDSSEWAKDGECDDPRFTGTGSAQELVDADIKKDATDCKAAFVAGTVTLKDTGTNPADIAIATPINAINFGDDSSEWAKDGECDDPRFTGTGSAEELVDADLMKDATDCRAAYEAGTVTLKDTSGAAATTPVGEIDFGDDSSEWAKDGECDDPRFIGTGVASTTLSEDIKKDATDCKAAVEAGTATFQGEQAAAAFDFGSDFSKWANDGECDDLRFEGPGTNKKLLTEDLMGDATDCKALLDEGRVSIRQVYTPEYAAGAPYDSSDIDFGDNSSSYANDGECDDPRFQGPGAAATLLDSDRMSDADDCKAAFEAGTVVLIDGES